MSREMPFGNGAGKMKAILRVVGIAALAMLFCIGCNDNSTGGGYETEYTITFNANGGTVTPANGKTGMDGRLASLPTPARNGYNFTGWYTMKTGGTQVTAGTVFSGNTVIYARWATGSGNFVDGRDGRVYRQVTIGAQRWMAENLNYRAEGSRCYDNDSANCAKYGRLYSWDAAMSACPAGWRLPSDAEWDILMDYVGGFETAGTKLKSKTGWNNNGNGTDVYEFSALPGGLGNSGNFTNAGSDGYWWSATETEGDAGFAWYRGMGSSLESVDRYNSDKRALFSVRCVQDGGNEIDSVGYVPSAVVPDDIRDKFEDKMPLYSGTTPPDIIGQYLTNSQILAGSSLSSDVIGSDNWADMYIAFIDGLNGKLSYREKQGTGSEGESDDVVVEVVGNSNNFTAYFIKTGVSKGISNKNSTVISGTLTNSGISGFHYAFIMLEKGSDPTNELVPVNTYRIFKENDGLAEKYNWLSNKLQITFNANGGTVTPTSATTGENRRLASLPTPTRDGYTFDGWFTTAETGGTQVSTSTTFSGNTTVYARWETEPVTPPSENTFVDSRDGKTYKKVTIGTQTWMAQNLNYDVPSVTTDVCYENKPDSCTKYGRLYNWATAKTACPAGWHLPSDGEWTTLENTVGGRSTAGTKLKSADGWNSGGNGTDDYAFSALPGGDGNSGGLFYYAGSSGYWWSSTEDDALNAWIRYMFYSIEGVDRGGYGKTNLFSVRCVRD